MSIASSERPADTKLAGAHHPPLIRSSTRPLYVVCSPRQGVGKTLLSRLLIEFHSLEGRPVTAFDLADEGPQLADFMPDRTTVADISEIFGQMAFFDSLFSEDNSIKVIDLGHRIFSNFFIVVQKIGLFEELRRNAIEPLLLFIVNPDPRSAKAYSILQRRFADVPLLPVRNRAVASGTPYRDAFPNVGAVPVSPEIPVLGPALKALVEQQSFSFAQFWRKALERFPARLDDELRPWMKRVFFQFRQIDICLMCEGVLGEPEAADSSQANRSDQQKPVIRKPPAHSPPPASILDYDAGNDVSVVPCDPAFAARLQKTASLSNENCNRATTLAYTLSAELRDAQRRINELECKAAERRAEAETALARLQAEADARLEQTKRAAEDRAERAITEAENRVVRLQDELAQAKKKNEELSAETAARIERIKKQADKRAREKAEAESRVARLQDELAQLRQDAEQSSMGAVARIERIEKEANERVARAEADTDARLARARAEIEGTFTRFEAELVQARQRAERAEAQIERIKREADERVRGVEADAARRFERVRTAADHLSRLEAELADATRRAENAEQWLLRIREEVEGRLIPSFAAMSNWRAERP